jgi:hypothetical protein
MFASENGGLVIPQDARSDLLRYIAHGEIPESYVKGILFRDFDETFYNLRKPMDYARVAVVWEFVQKHFPADAWGSERKVIHYSLQIKNGLLGRLQATFIQENKEGQSACISVD